MEVAHALSDPQFEIYSGSNTRPREQDAREWLAIRLIDIEIAKRRLLELTSRIPRPHPYDLPQLCDLRVDDEGLVPLSAFEFDGSALERNGRAFMMAPQTESENAPYWFLRRVRANDLYNGLSIRLDPFMHGPAESYPRMFYAMVVYGRPLDWNRLANLREAEHGTWFPDSEYLGYQRTEFAWTPTSDGVQFVCEEIPRDDRFETRAARYLHAIYEPAAKQIIHLDGALRIYTGQELVGRTSSHVRAVGKAGTRTKLFRIDKPIDREAFADLVSTYFVWNDDVQRYFGAR
jgi:hypothetical protein